MATATTSYLSVEEYLKTTYRPDVDYVDGHIEERNVGEFDHGDLQSAISMLLRIHDVEWNVRVVTETRVQVGPQNFRLPDVCVNDATTPRERIIRTAPLLCIEILSPRDSFKRMRIRIDDYLKMGTQQVWIFDPQTRTATVCSAGGDQEFRSGILILPGTKISLDLEQSFRTLDR